MAVIGTLAFNFQTVLPLFATRDLDGGGGLILAADVGRQRRLAGRGAHARPGAPTSPSGPSASPPLGFGASMLGLAAAPNRRRPSPSACVMGFTSISFMTTSTAIVQLRADAMMRGRVLALQAIVFLGSTPIGGPIVGAICEHFGARWGLATGAVATSAPASTGWPPSAAARSLPVPPTVSAGEVTPAEAVA